MTDASERLGRKPAPWRLLMWGAIAGILVLPLVAMQFTREVAWDVADFAFAGVLLSGAGLLFELAHRGVRNRSYRAAIGAVLVLAVLVIWADAAVGIF